MFSSVSFGEWTKFVFNTRGDSYYVDFDRIRKHDGFRYYWVLMDMLEPDKYGTLSVKTYVQADCEIFKYKELSMKFYNQPMGQDSGQTLSEESEWKYPSPTSAFEIILTEVCEQ